MASEKTVVDLKSRKHHVRQLNVYFLQNERKTYIGCTNNMRKRLKQHKRILPGGAKYTGSWKDHSKTRLIAFISGFPDRPSALSYEWHCKRYCPKELRLKGANVRFCGFFAPLLTEKFAYLKNKLVVHLVENLDLASILCEQYPLKDVTYVTEP